MSRGTYGEVILKQNVQMRTSSYIKNGESQVLTEIQGNTPEHALWTAVIISLVRDYEDYLNDATVNVRKGISEPMNINLKYKLAALRREALTQHINDVCENIGFSNYHVLKHFDKLDKQFNLAAVTWITREEKYFFTVEGRLASEMKVKKAQ